MQEIELTRPLPELSLSAEETGVALVVRRRDRPVGFVLHALPAGATLSPKEVGGLIATEAGEKVVEEMVREELRPALAPAPLPALTFAVCTHDRPDLLKRCLQSVLSLRTAGAAASDPGRANEAPAVEVQPEFEILVVDNAPSDDRTRRLVESLQGVRYAREPMPGLNFARNRALAEANGELIAFLDDDVTVDRGWLAGLAEAWSENEDAGGFTGLVLPYELDTRAQVLFEQRGGFRRGFHRIRYGRTLAGNNLYPAGAGIFGAGCNMTFRRDLLKRLGGFDEALDTGPPLPGGGDLDIFYRVVRAGYPLVYEPRCLVRHRHRRAYAQLRRQYWTWGLGFMAFLMKSHASDVEGRSRIRSTVAWWFPYQGGKLCKSLLRRHALPPDLLLAELWGGVVGLAGEYGRSRRRVRRIRERFA